MEKDKWEDSVIKTCGSSVSVQAIDMAKQVKEPLLQKHEERKGIDRYKNFELWKIFKNFKIIA